MEQIRESLDLCSLLSTLPKKFRIGLISYARRSNSMMHSPSPSIDLICILSVGLELVCDGGSCGETICV